MIKNKIVRKGKLPIYRWVSGNRFFDSKRNAKIYENSIEYGNDVYNEHQPAHWTHKKGGV